jgi:SAM-dependent methyltransferase
VNVPTEPRPATEYLFGAGEEEIARLLERVGRRRPASEMLLDRLAVAPGSDVLDVGCGPLGILDLLAQHVGDTGSVVGVDREPAMLAAARRVLAEQGLNRVRLVQASAAAMPLPTGSFDLVHERLALVSLAEAPDAIAEMVRVTRPGGWVALQEYDHVSLLCQPPHPAWDVLMNAWHRVRVEAGMDSTVGRHLPGLLRAARLRDITVEVHSSVRWPGPDGHVLPLYMAAQHRDRMTTVGGLAAAELDAAVVDLTAHFNDPGTILVNPLLFQAWGRKQP